MWKLYYCKPEIMQLCTKELGHKPAGINEFLNWCDNNTNLYSVAVANEFPKDQKKSVEHKLSRFIERPSVIEVVEI